MIKLSWIAELCMNLYYSGRVKEGKKLDFEEFDLLVQMANATLMRKAYFDMLDRADAFEWYGYQLESQTFKVPAADVKGRRKLVFEENKGFMRLPKGMGIFHIEPVEGDTVIRLVTAGTKSLFAGEDFDDLTFAENRGKSITFYNLPECVEEVEIDGILSFADLDVPMDMAIDIINLVLFESLRTIGNPIDKTNDGDPNLLTVKAKLAEKANI